MQHPGEVPTEHSKRYAAPFYLTEDGQACQFKAPLGSAARYADSDCIVLLRAVTIADRFTFPCLGPSVVYAQTFNVLAA